MRRADRLFQLVQILRNKKIVTAKYLAERLEVSERTIYRDVQDLSLSGVPIEGEAGVGYMLRHTLDVPPLMFSQDEIQALVLGARMVKTWGGKALGQAADAAIEKITGALPDQLKHLASESQIYAIPYRFENSDLANMDVIRKAINDKHRLSFAYVSETSGASERSIKPLALYFWGQVWTLTGWCELRDAFRNFRIDKMQKVVMTDCFLPEQPGQTLEAYIAQRCQGDL